MNGEFDMALFMVIAAITLSIIKANGWIIVPTYCIVILYILAFMSVSIATSVSTYMNEKKKEDKEKENQKWSRG